MLVLLCNDDGIRSPGLEALRLALGRGHEVWVVAPDRERSGCSHSITVGGPVVTRETGERMFACGGTPVDCVNVALARILPKRPDIVVSGVNLGGNIGTDLLYSGTAAAARHAALGGLPAVAVSVDGSPPWHPARAAAFVAANLGAAVDLCPPDSLRFLNVNAPNTDCGPFVVRAAGIARTWYTADIETFRAPTGEVYHFYRGSLATNGDGGETDLSVVRAGAVAVSLVHAQPGLAAELDASVFRGPAV